MLTLLAQTADVHPAPISWPAAIVILGLLATSAYLAHCISR